MTPQERKALRHLANSISLAFGEFVEAFTDQPEAGGVLPPRPSPASQGAGESAPLTAPLPFEDYAEIAAEVIPEEGSLANCPKHHKPFTEGTYGPYCRSMTDDPAWANKKGYCTITPKSAATWLRAHAA